MIQENMSFSESFVEDAALARLGELAYAIGHGPLFSHCESTAERDSFGQALQASRSRKAPLAAAGEP